MTKLETIEGIGPVISEKLSEAGVGSIEALLKNGASKSGRHMIAEQTGITEMKILRLVNHADLMRIKGIGGEYSELLEWAGVDSVPELAQRNAANLLEKITSVNEEKQLVRELPSEKQLSDWVTQAGVLERIVQH